MFDSLDVRGNCKKTRFSTLWHSTVIARSGITDVTGYFNGKSYIIYKRHFRSSDGMTYSTLQRQIQKAGEINSVDVDTSTFNQSILRTQ